MNRSLSDSGPVVDRPLAQKRRREEEVGGEDAAAVSSPSPPPPVISPWPPTIECTKSKASGTCQSLETAHSVMACSTTAHSGEDEPTTRMQQSNNSFDFSLPVYSDELGRLPIWPNGYADVTSGSYAGNVWPSFPQPSSSSSLAYPSDTNLGSPQDSATNVLADIDQPQFQLDPELEAIFSELLPDGSYGSPFAMASSSSQTGTSYAAHPAFYGQVFGGGSNSSGGGMESSVFVQDAFVGSSSIPPQTSTMMRTAMVGNEERAAAGHGSLGVMWGSGQPG